MAVAAPAAALAAFIVAWVLTPRVARLALNRGAVDHPDERKVHTGALPRWGGLGMYAAFGLVSVVALLLTHSLDPSAAGVLVGAGVVLAVGAVDDWRRLSAWYKLLAQMVAAGLAIGMGVKVEFVRNPFGPGYVEFGAWSGPVTLLWLVGMTNAFNLIDGVDGLAAGVAAIAGTTSVLVAHRMDLVAPAILAASLTGVACGFLRFNFYPAQVFMGDSGAYFLGFSLASVSVLALSKVPAAITVGVPLLMFAIPLLDTAFAILRRLAKGQPVLTSGDRGHLHHRLLDRGMSQRQVVIAIYAVTAALCAAAYHL